jgi:hypothetical protein
MMTIDSLDAQLDDIADTLRYAVANRELLGYEDAHEALDALGRLRAQRQAVLDLCDADDEATLRPDPVGYEPIAVPWKRAVRAALGAAT